MAIAGKRTWNVTSRDPSVVMYYGEVTRTGGQATLAMEGASAFTESSGTYTITLEDKPAALLSFHATGVGGGAEVDNMVTLISYVASTGVVTFEVAADGIVGNLANDEGLFITVAARSASFPYGRPSLNA